VAFIFNFISPIYDQNGQTEDLHVIDMLSKFQLHTMTNKARNSILPQLRKLENIRSFPVTRFFFAQQEPDSKNTIFFLSNEYIPRNSLYSSRSMTNKLAPCNPNTVQNVNSTKFGLSTWFSQGSCTEKYPFMIPIIKIL